ncbi:beta-galactosidase-like [Punica granatum]|uniref:beta-galactosidase n=1 Tax=Punica granatum TaxID=22663 RepID=A0A6P8BUQ7_PUNGR|nr:beta-galactosidase-like [Punica granatum]
MYQLKRVLHLFILKLNLFLCLCSSWASGTTVSYDKNALIIDGQRRIINSGSIHYPRSLPEMWPDLIKKAKDGGLDAVESYVFWDVHEPRKGQYDFTGRANIIKFFKLVQQAGLYGILRIGPYVSAEWNYGGFPMWLHNVPGIQLRTNNEVYKKEMQTFTTKIVNMFKEAKLFAPQGGPIILTQIENGYGNIMDQYGAMGKEYIQWCAEFAESLKVGVPWIMCQQHDAPKNMIDTCNGYYCDTFNPSDPNAPKMFTENFVGGPTKWGDRVPHRPAEDVAFAVASFFQAGGVLQNYYMYHGGTNFGRTSGGPYITTSYDYDAPINEYGMVNQPKWGHLRNLHAALKRGENLLTSGNSTNKQLDNGVTLTTYTNSSGGRFCFLSNPSTNATANVDLQQDGKYNLPPWSVSILIGCNLEIYNTARVNAQTSITGYNPTSINNASSVLSWSWTPEPKTAQRGKAFEFNAPKLLDQKEAAVDASDYLWYSTSVDIKDASWTNLTLHVNTSGDVLHGYVNGQPLGFQWGNSGGGFVFERPVSLKLGKNTIYLLSVTVGFPNYGAFFELTPVGLAGGPVQLVNGNATIDLSSNSWSYKVALNGELAQLYSPNTSSKVVWQTNEVPILSPLTWYKARFQAPAGTDPVVLDLQGMKKGQAWVNGISIGRYWMSVEAKADGCSENCNYRGNYSPEKCLTNCGEPTQSWYHVPRSLIKKGVNTLVLFEEFGGDPTKVNFETVVVTSACAKVPQGGTLELSCLSGHTMSEIRFASYGNPQGSCRNFSSRTCESATSKSVVQEACLGKQWCSVPVSDANLGSSGCTFTVPWLAVEAVCQ